MDEIHFKTAKKINRKLFEMHRSDSKKAPSAFVIYRNQAGEIGGYSANCMLPDSTVYYFDVDGGKLGETYFGKYHPKNSKRTIESLKKQFPLKKMIVTPK